MAHLAVTTSFDVENSVKRMTQWDAMVWEKMRMDPGSLKVLVWDAYTTGVHQRLVYVLARAGDHLFII